MLKRLERFLARDSRGRFFIEVLDKINTQELLKDKKTRYCPPHKLPPVLKGQVNDEPCHIHTSRWRDYHHIPFCKLLKCPHYNDMMQAREEYKPSKK